MTLRSLPAASRSRSRVLPLARVMTTVTGREGHGPMGVNVQPLVPRPAQAVLLFRRPRGARAAMREAQARGTM